MAFLLAQGLPVTRGGGKETKSRAGRRGETAGEATQERE